MGQKGTVKIGANPGPDQPWGRWGSAPGPRAPGGPAPLGKKKEKKKKEKRKKKSEEKKRVKKKKKTIIALFYLIHYI